MESSTTPLLGSAGQDVSRRRESHSSVNSGQTFYLPAERVLPLGLLAALAMSSTAATAYYTYATLLCKDATHCEGNERKQLAGFVTIATTVSNVLGMLALGPLQRLSRTRLKLGLLLWIAFRSMSAVMLLFGVKLKNIHVALCNRIFEGLASDNLLHFALNTAYAQQPTTEKGSVYIGYSLALYMVGISTSPFVTGLLKDFTVSFLVALALFGIAATYLQLYVSPRPWKGKVQDVTDARLPSYLTENSGTTSEQRDHSMSHWDALKTLVLPLRTLGRHHPSLFYGLSLFMYNLVQSYVFSALLVHTSIKFGFTGKQNGLLITIVHSIGATYIFMSLYVTPKILNVLRTQDQRRSYFSESKSRFLAPLSLLFQSTALLAVGLASRAWHVYIAASLLAVGLSTPSFIKAHVIRDLQGSAKSEALAALAMMETVGDVLGPLALGGWQSYSSQGGSVFFLASGMVVMSLSLFVCGLALSSHSAAKETQEWDD